MAIRRSVSTKGTLFFSGEESVVNDMSVMSPSIDGSQDDDLTRKGSLTGFDPDGLAQTTIISSSSMHFANITNQMQQSGSVNGGYMGNINGSDSTSGSGTTTDSAGKIIVSSHPTAPARQRVTGDDPLSINSIEPPKIRTESLTIRQADESRIVAAMATAAKKQTTGSVYSVKVDLSVTGALGIGVKDLPGNLLAVSMLKRANGQPGAGESAGVRLGDVIFGVNFIAVRDGSRTLLSVLKRENERRRRSVHLQCWRCHQLCSDSIPGATFPKADDVIVQAYALFRSNVFSDWERWNFIEILLSHMLDEMKLRAALEAALNRPEFVLQQQAKIRAKQLQIVDLERNILQAKGLRTALCVRIVHTKAVEDTVVYVLRIEDVETGLQWVVHRRYRDFYALNTELMDLSAYTRDITFPSKRMSLRIARDRLIEQRVVGLEQYIRRVLHTLTLYASMDPTASRSLRHLQNFLGVDKYIDSIHPPRIDDQRFIELMAFRLLNDFNSPACQQCVRFVANIDLESLLGPDGKDGFKPMLQHLALALSEVDSFMLANYQQQMEQSLKERNQKLTNEQVTTFIRRCVRRQVEAAIFLPLRRQVLKIIFPFINAKAHEMQHALHILQQASPKYFTVDPAVTQAKAFPRAIKAFREVIHAYLPADQGQLLMHAAAAVMQLYSECSASKESDSSKTNISRNTSNKEVAAIESRLSLTNSDRPRIASKDAGSTLRDRQLSSAIAAKIPHSEQPATEEEPEVKPLVNSKKLEMLLMPPTLSMLLSPEEPRTGGATLFDPSTPISPKPNSAQQPIKRPDETTNTVLDPTVVHGGDQYQELQPLPPGSVVKAAVFARSPEPDQEQDLTPFGGLNAGDIEAANAALQAVANTSLFEEMELEKSRTETLAHANMGEDQDICPAEPSPMARLVSDGTVLAEPSSSDLESNLHRSTCDMVSPNPPNLDTPEMLALAAKLKSKFPSLQELAGAIENSAPDTSVPVEENRTECELLGKDVVDDVETNIRSSILSAGSDQEGMHSSHNPGFYESTEQKTVVSADDFLPLFTFVLVQADMPQLVLVKELMMTLVADEESYGECGYYMATLEAAVHHIADLAKQYQRISRTASTESFEASYEDIEDGDDDEDSDAHD